jgi:hypothetical protein
MATTLDPAALSLCREAPVANAMDALAQQDLVALRERVQS